MAEVILGNHTIEEREAYIQAHVAVCKRTTRKKLASGLKNTSGKEMSVERAKRRCARNSWVKYVRHVEGSDLANTDHADSTGVTNPPKEQP